jgi:hypothetical protein
MRDMSGVFKGGLSRSWLNMPVVELTLWIDVQPSSSLIVLVNTTKARRPLTGCTYAIPSSSRLPSKTSPQ